LRPSQPRGEDEEEESRAEIKEMDSKWAYGDDNAEIRRKWK